MDFASAKIDRETLHDIAVLGDYLRQQTGIPHPNYVVIRMSVALLRKKILHSRKKKEE